MTDAEKLKAIRNEIDHAFFNDHHLAMDCQGVDFQKPPPGAVRSDRLLAILDAE